MHRGDSDNERVGKAASDAIVIVGAGIIGLDVALVLAERGLGPFITVIAEHLPGDTSATYTSPWAGCNFSGISGNDANALKWDRLGYTHLTRLASEHGDEAYIRRTASIEYWDEHVPHDKIKAISEYLEDFKEIPSHELPAGVKFGISFTTLTLNAPKHIEYLFRRLKDQYGVHFVRHRFPTIQAAYSSPTTRVVVNCTGIAAKTLPGVEDEKCYPTRGQVVLVKAPRVKRNVMRHGKDYETYVIPRPGTDGHVILGGYMQKGVRYLTQANSDGATYSYETESIINRCLKLCPELEPFDIIASFAGLRPSREGGARIEREEIVIDGNKKVLVHNYGAGGTGYQAGYGMAMDAVGTVDDVLRDLERASRRSRL
ncbi:D-aspartate oxidase [Trichoderma parareesei]|uniref:D-aspartate oxidase n=1 Tax=Trichoderma parareesei TaxID=858221 RepID=A0A2H2YZP2_TRIPA|nr:D-aspartate oxidase [Trichoderma parareesei]